jgi:ATP adenylyltransferase
LEELMALEPGTLWDRVALTTRRGLRSGVLQPIATRSEMVEDEGVSFVVREVSSLVRKAEAKRAPERPGNPFLPPYDPDLLVAEISPTHVGMLNRYNVVPHHLLVITRAFVDQRTVLDEADFAALLACMTERDCLGFYNGGEEAGASQPHKHLQVVPLPLAPTGPAIPLGPLLAAAAEAGVAEGLSFVHALAPADSAWFQPSPDASSAAERYQSLLAAVGLEVDVDGWLGPYNLLLTRRWMMVVPRSREHVDGMSLNALAYAGALLVRNAAEMERVKVRGPMGVLAAAGVPPG